MCGETMTFPDTVEEFMERYKIVDREQVYTNGAELIPIFRMKQWFDHVEMTVAKDINVPIKRGHWVGIDDYPYETWECDQCGYIHEELGGWVPRYCPDCGAKMEEQE